MKNTEFSWQLASPDQLSCMEMNECSSLSRKKKQRVTFKRKGERERVNKLSILCFGGDQYIYMFYEGKH
jgi:hypothetical protein